MSSETVRVRITGPGATPEYATAGAAGFDLRAHVDSPFLLGGSIRKVPTGLYFEIPDGYELQIRPRSGLSGAGVLVVNSPSTIDSDYRGEVQVLLTMLQASSLPVVYRINPGDRIAQAVLAPVVRAEFERVDRLSETARGEGRFGSTGVR